jgi:hypothetical protein
VVDGGEATITAPATRPALPIGGLTLAEAFHLLARALGELPVPAPSETLRARMAVLHGKEDSLLDTARFAKLLRQANDAEVADVRMVGEDQYEVSPHKADLALQKQVRATAAAAAAEPSNGDTPAPPPRQPAALRFRGGSRTATRSSDVPMFGVVELNPVAAAPAAAVAAPVVEPAVAAPAVEPSAKPARGRGRAAPKAAATKPAAPAPKAAAKTATTPKSTKKAAPKGKKASAKSSKPRGG